MDQISFLLGKCAVLVSQAFPLGELIIFFLSKKKARVVLFEGIPKTPSDLSYLGPVHFTCLTSCAFFIWYVLAAYTLMLFCNNPKLNGTPRAAVDVDDIALAAPLSTSLLVFLSAA